MYKILMNAQMYCNVLEILCYIWRDIFAIKVDKVDKGLTEL